MWVELALYTVLMIGASYYILKDAIEDRKGK